MTAQPFHFTAAFKSQALKPTFESSFINQLHIQSKPYLPQNFSLHFLNLQTMGCTSSNLLNQDEDFTHHIVSLTSTTYGLLTLDPPTPPPPFTLSQPPQPELINSWELMSGLDSTPDTFHFSPQPSKPSPFRYPFQENSNPNHKNPIFTHNPTPNNNNNNPIFAQNPNNKDSIFTHNPNTNLKDSIFTQNPNNKDPIFTQNPNPNHEDLIFTQNPSNKDSIFTPNPNPSHKDTIFIKNSNPDYKDPIFTKDSDPDDKNPIFTQSEASKREILDGFEEICPPKGENKVVIYTTSLRGVRKTFEACNAVRAVLEGFGVLFSERDVSMDRGFKDELWELMKGKDKSELVPPRVFVKGRYVGGSDEVLKIVEDGCFGQLVDGLPKVKPGYVCETCGGARFLPCCSCNGSCKVVMVLNEEIDGDQLEKTVTVKCTDCNENGLVQCPVCS